LGGGWITGELRYNSIDQLVSKENKFKFYGTSIAGAGMLGIDFTIDDVPVASLLVAMVGVGGAVGMGGFTWAKK
jgi:hypothetical protein